MYLKRQKKDAAGKIPLYVRVTIDGDVDEFPLSRKMLPDKWSHAKQKCIGKLQETLLINTKITNTKGDLTAIFDRIPVAVREIIQTRLQYMQAAPTLRPLIIPPQKKSKK